MGMRGSLSAGRVEFLTSINSPRAAGRRARERAPRPTSGCRPLRPRSARMP